MADLPPPPPKGPNPYRDPLPKGPALPPTPPPQEAKPTRPQFKDKEPQILGPVSSTPSQAAGVAGQGLIMGPGDSKPPNAAVDAEDRAYSNDEWADMQWVKESMWRYENRPRGRTSQATLGPSEIGTECERKLVYRLRNTLPFTQGSGPNWPAIVGTGVHSWMEGMMRWLDQDRGRFLIEHGVEIIEGEFAGTLDVYDRLTKRVRDWKFPGARAVRKYKNEGVGEQYRTQGQVYAYGLARQGETPKDISVTMIARDAASVDQGIHVEIFPYQPSLARAAVDKFNRLKELSLTPIDVMDVEAKPSRLCDYCAYHAPGVVNADGVRACPGR